MELEGGKEREKLHRGALVVEGTNSEGGGERSAAEAEKQNAVTPRREP